MILGRAEIVRRETALCVVISIAISAVVFALVFGFSGPTSVRGLRGFAFDFVPQTFMVALMGSAVPALAVASRQNLLPGVQFAIVSGKTAIAARAVLVAVAAAMAVLLHWAWTSSSCPTSRKICFLRPSASFP